MYFEKGIHGSHAVFGLNLCIQSCDLDLIYDEVERRMQDLYKEGLYSSKELREERCAMMQGVYSTLMMLASNWPEVHAECDKIEYTRNWWHLD